jgi:hypothetical protein
LLLLLCRGFGRSLLLADGFALLAYRPAAAHPPGVDVKSKHAQCDERNEKSQKFGHKQPPSGEAPHVAHYTRQRTE